MSNKICEAQKLRDIITLEKGKPPAQQPYFGQDAELYLTPEYLRGRGTAEPVRASVNAVRVSDGDTIILWDGSNAGEFFRGRKGILASTMSRIQHGETFGVEYFFYAVKSWESYLKGQTSGSGIPHIDKEVFGKIEILRFDKPEQTKIAEILSTVDRAIEQTEAIIAKQQRIKTGLMQDLLTRGIDEHGNLRSEETHEFKDSPLGRIPVEWEVVKLSDYIAFIRSGLSRRILENDIGVPVITSTNIQRSRLDTTQLSYWYLKDPQGAKTESFFLDDGDILLNFVNSVEQIGKVCLFQDLGRPTTYTTNLFRIKASQVASQDFLFYLLDSQVVQNEIKLITKPAVNQASFTTGDFLGISVPFIPYDEQLRIVEFLFALNSHNNGAMLSLSKLKHEKTALMQDLLTGKMRVTPLLTEPQEAGA